MFDSFRKAYYENAYNFPYQTIQTLECLNDIKASYSICVQSWKGKETVNIVSSQSYIIDEFNNFFSTKWEHSEEMRRNKNWVLSQIEKRLDLIKKG